MRRRSLRTTAGPRGWLPWAASLCFLGTGSPGWAHVNSFVSARLRARSRRVTVQYTLAAPDLKEALGTPGEPTEQDLRHGSARLQAYLGRHIQVTGAPSPLELEGYEVSWHRAAGSGPATVLVTWHLASRLLLERICIRYELFFDLDPAHVAAWTVSWAGSDYDHTFSLGKERTWCLRRLAPASEKFLDRLEAASSALRTWTTWAAVCLLALAPFLLPGRRKLRRLLTGLLGGTALGLGVTLWASAGLGAARLLTAGAALLAVASRLPVPRLAPAWAEGAGLAAGTALCLSILSFLPAAGRDQLGLAAAACTWVAAAGCSLLGASLALLLSPSPHRGSQRLEKT